MNKRKIQEKEINFIMGQVEKGASIMDVCYIMGISQATFYSLRKKYTNSSRLSCSHRAKLEQENDELRDMIRELEKDKRELLYQLKSRRKLF